MAEEAAPELKLLGSLEELDQVEDTTYVDCPVPEWKMNLRFGSLSAGTMIEFVESNEGPAKKTAGLRLINDSMVDASNKRIGSDKGLAILKKKDARVCNRLVEVILKLNGLDKKAQEAAKNASGEASSDASPTA